MVRAAERSLIEADRSALSDQRGRAEARYRMLETIRQYCASRAAAAIFARSS